MTFSEFANEYLEDLKDTFEKLDIALLEKIGIEIKEKIGSGSSIFMIGNGGSSATPSHSAGDFSKELGAKVFCLTDNIPSLTAWANDTNYDNIFLGPLKISLNADDLVIGYSGSGNSANILKALKYAQQLGCSTIGITGNYLGKGPGEIYKVVDMCLTFETESMERIEDMQLIVNHIIKESIKSSSL